MSKSDKLGFKVFGLIAVVALIYRFLGIDIAFGVTVIIVALAFWKLFEDRL